jgi:holo-[acyl-carrier protein] synthase
VSVSRVRETTVRFGPRFLDRVFSANEQEDCAAKVNPYQSFAARFAAKEACLKALGTGATRGLRLRDVEVRIDACGAPHVRLHGLARKRLGGGRISVSLSHSGDWAIAQAVVLTGPEGYDGSTTPQS